MLCPALLGMMGQGCLCLPHITKYCRKCRKPALSIVTRNESVRMGHRIAEVTHTRTRNDHSSACVVAAAALHAWQCYLPHANPPASQTDSRDSRGIAWWLTSCIPTDRTSFLYSFPYVNFKDKYAGATGRARQIFSRISGAPQSGVLAAIASVPGAVAVRPPGITRTYTCFPEPPSGLGTTRRLIALLMCLNFSTCN